MSTPQPPRSGAPRLRQATSLKNPALALVRSLEAKRVRRERRLVVAEGEDLVDAALAAGLRLETLIVDAGRVGAGDPRLVATSELGERYAVSTELMRKTSTLASAPRMIGVFSQPAPFAFRDVPMPPSLALWLTGIGDPGNVGTLVRTAGALGCDWVALGPGSADPYNPKAVRAAMGATFTVPILDGVSGKDLATREGVRVVAGVVRGGAPPWEVNLRMPSIVAVGAERAGVEAALDDIGGAIEVVRVTIPQAPGAESLNVAAAGAILLAEAGRQRATRAVLARSRPDSSSAVPDGTRQSTNGV
jgi:TrmH family RNA methyltransferase